MFLVWILNFQMSTLACIRQFSIYKGYANLAFPVWILHFGLTSQVILPTCLRGHVPAVHWALLKLAYCLRQLQGQIVSQKEANDLGVVPGAIILDNRALSSIHREMVRALVMLEGSVPPMHLNPLLHRLVHYALQSLKHGSLWWFSMYSFERFNKKIKNLVRNRSTPMASIAKNIQVDIAYRFMALASHTDEYDKPTVEGVAGRSGIHWLTRQQAVDLANLGILVTAATPCLSFKFAYVLGVHFRAGEWGCRRCGSVVTLMHEGRSRYCVVHNFIQVRNQEFACVTWLSVPHYPYAPNRLVVRVRVDNIQTGLPSIIPLTMIDPTRVLVEPDVDNVHYYVMRVKGWDRSR